VREVTDKAKSVLKSHPRLRTGTMLTMGILVIAVLIWQAVTASGNPDPTSQGISPSAGVIYTAVLVYREGLECLLVLSAIIAGLSRTQKIFWNPIATGAGTGFGATLVTWFILVGILALASNTISEIYIQAATGLLAVVVLLVVMNWFFHRIYWTSWIAFHNRWKNRLIKSVETADQSDRDEIKTLAYKGLFLLGFTSVFREGFEVDIFLQNVRLQIGDLHVFLGSAFALVLIGITAYFTFIAHQKLPYKKMLVFTGVLLGFVLEIMVGEQVNEMQLAHWLPTHTLPIHIPAWMGMWFSLYGNWETILAQLFAAVFVLGSYYIVQFKKFKPKKSSSYSRSGVSDSVALESGK